MQWNTFMPCCPSLMSAHATVGLPLSWRTASDGSGMVMPTSWGSGQIKLSYTWSLYNKEFYDWLFLQVWLPQEMLDLPMAVAMQYYLMCTAMNVM